MNQEIIYSLKPKFIDLIIRKEKNHEFRNLKPKFWPQKLWFYITAPECKLMYVADVDLPIMQPYKIEVQGVGNLEFNEGEKFAKFAYPILHLYKIKQPLDLKTLKEKFNFSAPQGFVYLSKYPKLFAEITKTGLERIF